MIALRPRRRMATRQTSTKTSTALRGQVALVTGATRGIGLALARALAANSCNLILAARDEKALARISRELASAKIKVLTHPCDIRDPHDVDAFFPAPRRPRRESSTTHQPGTRLRKNKSPRSPLPLSRSTRCRRLLPRLAPPIQ